MGSNPTLSATSVIDLPSLDLVSVLVAAVKTQYWTEGWLLISFLPQNARSVKLAPSSSFLNVLSKRRRRWLGQFPVPFRVLPNSFLPVLRRVQRDTSGNAHHGC